MGLGPANSDGGDLQAAIAAWQAADQRFDPSIDALDYSLGQHQDALTNLERLVKLQPSHADWLYQLGLLQAAVNPIAAVPYLDMAIGIDPALDRTAGLLRKEILASSQQGDRSYALVSAGRALASLGVWYLAAVAFQGATQADPGYAEAWAYLGEARQHLRLEGGIGESQTGLGEIHKALRLDPASLSGHLFRSMYWSRKGRYDLSVQAVERGLRYHPQEAMLLAELGRVLALSGQLAPAAQAYLRSAALEPREAAYQRLIVGFSLENSYLVEALALPAAQSALKIAPDDARNLDSLAQVEIRLGNLEEAEILLEKALAIDPLEVSALLHYGYLLVLRGDFTEALEQFQLVQRLAPNSALAEQAQRLIEGMLQ